MAGIFYWLTSAPRSLPYISSYIEDTVKHLDTGYQVKVENSIAKWSGWKSPLVLSVSDVMVIDKEGKNIATFPEMKFRISPMALLFGKLRFKDIVILNAKIDLIEIKTQEGGENSEIDILSHLKEIMHDLVKKKSAPFRSIEIINAEFSVHYENKDLLWKINSAKAAFYRVRRTVELHTTVLGDFAGKKASIKSVTSFGAGDNIKTLINFEGIKLSALNYIIPAYKKYNYLTMNVDGNIEININSDFTTQNIKYMLSSADDSGKLLIPELFSNNFSIKNFSCSGNISDNFTSFVIEDLLVDTDGPSLKGYNININYPSLDKASIKGRLELENMAVDDISKYWPEKFAYDAREWVVTSLSKGKIAKVELDLDLKPGELVAEKLADDSLSAKLYVKDTVMNYHPELPEMKDISGVVSFTGNTMTIEVEKAKVEKSVVENGKAYVPELVALEQVITVSGDVIGDAKDLKKYLALDAANNKSAFKINFTEGTSRTHFELNMPLLKDLLVKQVQVKVHANLSNVSIPEISEDIDIRDGNFELDYDDKKLEVVGEALINSMRSTIRYKEEYDEPEKDKNRLVINSTASPAELGSLGYDLSYMNGSLNFSYTQTKDGDSSGINMQVIGDNAEVNAIKYGYKKLLGKPFKLEVYSTENDKAEYRLSAEDLSSKGSVKFKDNTFIMKELDIKEVTFSKTELSILYSVVAEDSYKLKVRGKTMNLAPLIENMREFRSGKKEKMELDVDVTTAYLKNDHILTGLKGNIKCGLISCEKAEFNAKLNKNFNVSYRIKPRSALTRELSIISDNAGAVIGGLDISKHISGGVLDVNSKVTEKDGRSIHEGRLIINNLSLIKAPLLAKILTLASFTGILDLLNGKGITLKKLSAHYMLADDVLEIKNGKTYGESLGVTAEGKIDMKTKTSEMDITGTVIPAYTLNSLIGKVPLFGDVLTGGKGGGIVASTYKVKGTLEDPQVSVNPLAMLAPGFLRNFFDIFEKGDVPEKVELPEKPVDVKVKELPTQPSQ